MANPAEFEEVAEWQSLMPEAFSSNHEINTLDDCDFNLDDLQDEFLELDQWLGQNYFAEGSAKPSREQAPSLAPPLYTAYSNPEGQTSDEHFAGQRDHQKVPEASLAGLSSLVKDLQLALDDKTRKLNLLAEYLEQLQPWIEDITGNVHSLLSQDSQQAATSIDDPCNPKSPASHVLI